MIRDSSLAVLSIAAIGLSACSGTAVVPPGASQGIAVSVQPRDPVTVAGGTVSFTSVVTGTADTAVVWDVVEATGGTISTNGLYTAPMALGQYHVMASSHANPSVQAIANVVVTSPAGLCDAAPLRTTGTVHYYCDCGTGASAGCTPGNDANAGTSPAAPRQTISNAFSTFDSMPGGDTVALCRTGAWDSVGGTSVSNGSCSQGSAGWPAPSTSSTTCDFRDYVPSWGTASSPRPILNAGATPIFGFYAGTAGRGFRFWNLEMNTSSNQGMGFEVVGSTGYLDVCGIYWHDGGLGFNDQSASRDPNGHFTIRESQFARAYYMAILGASDYLVTSSNVFANNGAAGTPQTHDVYYQQNCEPWGGCTNGQIVNNYSTSDATCGGVRFVVHGSQNGLVVANNEIVSTGGTNANCYGIQSAHSAAPAVHLNMLWTRNRIFNMPGTAIEQSCCQNCTVSDNIAAGSVWINSDTSCGAGTPGGTTVQNNDIYGATLNFGSGGGNAPNYVDNNAFYNPSCASGGDNATGVINVNGNVIGRQTDNYCSSNAATIWVNAPGGDYTPLNPGPLIGTANQTYSSPIAIGAAIWSPDDLGRVRTSPIDIGALAH